MKTFRIFLLSVLLLGGCALNVDPQKAQRLAENLLSDLRHENYSGLGKYYTDLANESEPVEQKTEKFRRIRETTGPIRSWELVSSAQTYDSDKGLNQLELKYKVVCEKVSVTETFLIINDEGKEKIIFQNIENLR